MEFDDLVLLEGAIQHVENPTAEGVNHLSITSPVLDPRPWYRWTSSGKNLLHNDGWLVAGAPLYAYWPHYALHNRRY